MIGYHVTTPKKLIRYQTTGAILPPVRFWGTEYSARKWMKHVNRTVLLRINTNERSWPLPVTGGAYWTDQLVRRWEVLSDGNT
jgi:hypothetical protein